MILVDNRNSMHSQFYKLVYGMFQHMEYSSTCPHTLTNVVVNQLYHSSETQTVHETHVMTT